MSDRFGDRLFNIYCNIAKDHSDEEKLDILDFIIDDVAGKFKKNPLTQEEKETVRIFKSWRKDLRKKI